MFSDSFGRKDSVSLSYFIRITIIAVVFCFILSYGLTLIFPDFLIGIFNPENDLELAVLAKEGMLIYFTGFIFTGLAHVFSTYFVSVNSPLPSTIISILQTGIVITPIVLILPVFFNLTGVWLAYPVAEGLILIVSLSLFIYKRKMLKL